MMQMRAWLRGAVLATGLMAGGAGAQPAEKPLRVVVNVGLQQLDPIVSPSFVTRNFAYLVFDTLVAMDSKGEIRPQMLEKWEISGDGLTWRFTLRPGLEWHDGQKVTAEDCVASLRRWGARDSSGRRLLSATREMRVVDDASFEILLSRPFGGVLDALAKPSVHVPFMMPARIAANTPPTQPVSEIIGSGPFIFERDRWVPGERTFFRRNPRYQPRAEPADGLAGGKAVHIERAELITLTDPATRAAALGSGEVDYLEYAPLDYLPAMQRDRKLVLGKPGGIAQVMGGVVLNHAQPPFDKLPIRQAVQQVLDQSQIVAVHGLPDGMFVPQCLSVYLCGTRYTTDAGAEALRDPSIARARELLKQGGYNNEPVVYMQAADSALINPMALVVIDRMKQAGFNVDVQTTDWATIAQRWISKEPVEKGGWSAISVIYTGFDMADPLSNVGIGYNCTGTAPWLYCDEKLTPLLQQFEAESDPGKRKAIAAQIQVRAIANVNFPFNGQFSSPAVWRRELQGVVDFGFPVLWNIRRAS